MGYFFLKEQYYFYKKHETLFCSKLKKKLGATLALAEKKNL